MPAAEGACARLEPRLGSHATATDVERPDDDARGRERVRQGTRAVGTLSIVLLVVSPLSTVRRRVRLAWLWQHAAWLAGGGPARWCACASAPALTHLLRVSQPSVAACTDRCEGPMQMQTTTLRATRRRGVQRTLHDAARDECCFGRPQEDTEARTAGERGSVTDRRVQTKREASSMQIASTDRLHAVHVGHGGSYVVCLVLCCFSFSSRQVCESHLYQRFHADVIATRQRVTKFVPT